MDIEGIIHSFDERVEKGHHRTEIRSQHHCISLMLLSCPFFPYSAR
jgi:hypothetical protein